MINLYKSISEKILEIVSAKEVDEKKLAIELNKRQELINNLKDEELKSFKEAYNTEKIYEYDEKIKIKIKSQMLSVRKELREYKLNKTVNTAYANMNKNNLNIFSRKV